MTEFIREEGFYWVSVDKGEPEVAEWLHNVWYLCGDDVSPDYKHSQPTIEVLSLRLVPPEV